VSERILVAEDDRSILRLVTLLLGRAHYEVDTARNGREALEKIEQRDYDVVLLDLMMPELSGLDVLERLCLLHQQRKFVVIMSAASRVAIDDGITLNVFATLRKPFENDELIATVRACIAAQGPSAGLPPLAGARAA
jgi:two-component system, OmpR family, response regulator ArlR